MFRLTLMLLFAAHMAACGGSDPSNEANPDKNTGLEYHRCSCNSLDNYDVEYFTVCAHDPVGADSWKTNDLACATKGGCTGCQCIPQQLPCTQDGCTQSDDGCDG